MRGAGDQAETFGLEVDVMATVGGQQYRHGDFFAQQSRGEDRAGFRFDGVVYWTKVADQWEDVFLEMRNRSHFIAWEGAGGDGCDSEPALTYR
ncbi:Conserved protein of uncharacterised function (part1) [Mycobacterium tuberculosis]|nr:Conserved protein of uncharacterised function (part1) [Mycobacterium tuberculosis]